MKVKANRSFQSSTLGVIEADQVFDAPDHLALQMISAGYLQEYETKVILNRPLMPTAPLSALPVGQALPQTTASELESGGKKRGRKKKEV